MRVQHLENEKEKDVEEKTALTARIEELVQQQERLHKMCEQVYGDCQELRAQHGMPASTAQNGDGGSAPKISHLFVEKKKRDLTGDKEPARRPSKKVRTTPAAKAAASSASRGKAKASAVTPSPSSRDRKTKAPDSSKHDGDVAHAQMLALLPTKTLDQARPGFSIEYKETDVLPNWTASYVTEGVQSILMHFYPGRSRPTPEWKHSGMLREWAPSLVCRHCQGTYSESLPLQGTQDGCVRLQRQIKKTFNLCVEHLLVCPIASNHSTDAPKELTKELDKLIRKQIDMLFDEEELDSSSEASHDEEEEEEEEEEESEPSEAMPAASSGGLKTTKLIVPELKSLVAESTWFLMEQMMPWYVRKVDKRNTNFFAKFKVGSRLLVCRHCLGFRSFSSAKNALRCPSSGVKHVLSSCTCCPPAIRAKLSALLKKNEGKEKKKLFLDKMFERVSEMDKDTLIAAQEEAVRKIESSFAKKMRGDDAKEESDAEEEEEEEHSAGEAKSDEASEMEVEESSPSSSAAPVSAAGPMGEQSIRVFADEDRDMVSERTAIIFEQMMPWVVRKKDREDNQYFAMYEVGSRQLVCRHCLAFRRFAAVNTTLKNISHASKHFREGCPAIPADIRASLKFAEGKKQPEPERRHFVERVFEHLDSLAEADIIREQELAESALPKKAPRRKSETGASRSRARHSKDTDRDDGANGGAKGAEKESKVRSDEAAGHSGDVGVAMSGLHAIGDIHDVHAFEHITKDWDLPAEKEAEMPDSKPEAEK